MPLETPVEQWMQSMGSAGGPPGNRREISFSLKKGQEGKLRGLAQVMRAMFLPIDFIRSHRSNTLAHEVPPLSITFTT